MDVLNYIKPIIDVEDTIVAESDEGWLPMDDSGLGFAKPLWTSPESGGWAVMFKWKKGFVAPTHKHLGAIHAYIISGKLQVRGGTDLEKGDYIYEANGVIHDEVTALEDTIHINIADGPIIFFDESAFGGYFGWEQVEGMKKALAA